jgi:predicted adenylyl cyclase CyaB
VLDQVDGLGCFAEIERIAADEAQVELAKQAIEELESRLGLEKKESRSYLGMILELPNR